MKVTEKDIFLLFLSIIPFLARGAPVAVSCRGTLIRKQGEGTLLLTGSNSYTGGTVVTTGTSPVTSILRVENDHALGNGNVAVMDGAVLFIAEGIALDIGSGHGITLENDGVTTCQKNFAGGETLNHFNAIRSSGANATVAQILSGTASFGTEPATPASNDEGRISDVFSLSGVGGETFVMQLSYTQTAYDAAFTAGIYDSELELRIGWLTGGMWVSVADGTFEAGGWNGSTVLGTYGVDVTNNVVWAVTNHNSEFAVVPEPSIGAMLGLGFVALFGFRRRRGECRAGG